MIPQPIIDKIIALLASIALVLTGISQQLPQQKFGGFNPTGGGTYRLQTSLGTTNTSIKLSSFKEPVSNIKYTMTYLGSDILYGTLDPQTSYSEFVSATGITQNADGTATLTGVVRGLSRTPAGSSCTASTTLAQTHAGQSIFILSNAPCMYSEYVKGRTNESITGLWSFDTNLPISSITATSSSQFATKAYADNVIKGGAPTSTEALGGKVELGTLAEQASSYDGGDVQPTVLQTKNSTSTCQIVGSYNLVASSTTGKLDKNCFDQTANYNYTGANNFASTTFSDYPTLPYTDPTGNRQAIKKSYFDEHRVDLATSSPANIDASAAGLFSIASTTIPAGALGNFNIVKGKLWVQFSALDAGSVGLFSLKFGGATSTTFSYTTVDPYGGRTGWLEFQIMSYGSAKQENTLIFDVATSTADRPIYLYGNSATTINSAVAQTVEMFYENAGGNAALLVYNYSIEIIKD